ncbi:hypothetical protein EVG20_g3680 [Dentipellis fragilis]|uniref:Mitochondrial carrier n=1 Tax=Dentipellis fragilis TaxID=205917 RepID=A0A4Y9Z0G5_9AGAM|nr:hypothetical protein EVG20_g3680 [Dentipellis fragilis]
MTSTLSPIIQAFSGAVGSASANAFSYPLDLVTTRLQTTRSKRLQGLRGALAILRYTIKKYGVRALYDGLHSDIASTILSSFLYFYAYSFLRSVVSKRTASKIASSSGKTVAAPILTISQELGLGFIAGVASRLVSTPLSITTVRLQMEREGSDDELEEVEEKFEEGKGAEVPRNGKQEKGVLYVVKSIYEEQGLKGFWRGFETTILLSLNPSFTFSFFQIYRHLFLQGVNRRRPTPKQAFFGAAIANSLATMILYPLILAKTRLQLAKADSSSSPATMLSVLRTAYRHEGGFPPGLYQGIEAQILKSFLSQGITFMVKQRWVAFINHS